MKSHIHDGGQQTLDLSFVRSVIYCERLGVCSMQEFGGRFLSPLRVQMNICLFCLFSWMFFCWCCVVVGGVMSGKQLFVGGPLLETQSDADRRPSLMAIGEVPIVRTDGGGGHRFWGTPTRPWCSRYFVFRVDRNTHHVIVSTHKIKTKNEQIFPLFSFLFEFTIRVTCGLKNFQTKKKLNAGKKKKKRHRKHYCLFSILKKKTP